VVSDLARDLRVRNTFLELPAEEEDDFSRAQTAPAALGQLGPVLDAMAADPRSSASLESSESETTPIETTTETASVRTSGRHSSRPLVVSDLARDMPVRSTFLELPAEPEDDHPSPQHSASAPPRLHTSGPEAGAIACPPDVPSVGSLSHATGQCKPCAFMRSTQGCATGSACSFCHLCDPETTKRLLNEKRLRWREWRKQERRAAAVSRRAALAEASLK
jgi:hypothetical protein